MARLKLNLGTALFIALLVGAFIYFVPSPGRTFKLPFFATTGAFTLASFELDDMGSWWFSGSPLSFACVDGSCKDDQNKFKINSITRPFVNTDKQNVITLPAFNDIEGKLTPTAEITILADIRNKDIKAVYAFGSDLTSKRYNINVGAHPSFTVSITGHPECKKFIEIFGDDQFQVVEWRSSNIQQGYGAFFLNGIKVCEANLTKSENIIIAAGSGQYFIGDNFGNYLPTIDIYAVGQRLPFNCRIDTTHEAFAIERFPTDKAIDLNAFSFIPVAFCKDSPVVRVTSAVAQGGVTSTTEPFLRWAEGKTLIVPQGEVWLTTYVFDWKRAGLSSGCSANDRYLVTDKKCESEARIVVATPTESGKVEANTLTESGKVIEQVVQSQALSPEQKSNVITLDKAPKPSKGPSTTTFLLVGGILAIIGIILLALRRR